MAAEEAAMTVAEADKLARILQHPLMRGLREATLAEIRRLLVRRNVRAGAHIFSKAASRPAGSASSKAKSAS